MVWNKSNWEKVGHLRSSVGSRSHADNVLRNYNLKFHKYVFNTTFRHNDDLFFFVPFFFEGLILNKICRIVLSVIKCVEYGTNCMMVGSVDYVFLLCFFLWYGFVKDEKLKVWYNSVQKMTAMENCIDVIWVLGGKMCVRR